jgi:hypothetical protein
VIAQVLAAIGLVVCVALMIRMVLSPARQWRWDAFWRRQLDRLRGAGLWLQRQWRLLRSSRGAQRAAGDAIDRARRARREVDRDGNVIKPRSFRDGGDKKPPLH